MSVHDRTLAVIEAFYEAAMDETLWPAALKNLSDLTKSQAASFWVLDGSQSPRFPTFISINFDQKSVQEYLGGMAALDPTTRYLVAHPRQSVVHDGLLEQGSDADTRAYYEWHERSVETRFRMVGQARLMPSVQAGVALHRTRKAGRYEPKEIERFEILHGHLERALSIAFRLGTQGTLQRLTEEWLHKSVAAVIFLDDRKRILFANRRAQELQADADGLRLSADSIGLLHKQDDERLQRLIAQAISPAASLAPSGSAMRARRPSGKRPYAIELAPVSGKYPVLSSVRPAVCVTITDPERQTVLPVQRLQAIFGLTPAEARLAALLASGEELRAAAGKLQITYGSARARLAQVFEKTDTRRQSELIRLLFATLAAED